MLCSLVSIHFDILQLGIQQKRTLQNLRLLIQRYAQFWLFRKGSENSFSSTFYTWFWREIHFLLYSVNWSNLIVWLPLLREILGNMYIRLLRHKVWHWSSLSTQAIFFIRQKIQDKNLNILRMKIAFKVKWKAFFIIFQGLSVAKRFSQTRGCACNCISTGFKFSITIEL